LCACEWPEWIDEKPRKREVKEKKGKGKELMEERVLTDVREYG